MWGREVERRLRRGLRGRSDGWLWRGGWDVLRRFTSNKYKKYNLPDLDLHYDTGDEGGQLRVCDIPTPFVEFGVSVSSYLSGPGERLFRFRRQRRVQIFRLRRGWLHFTVCVSASWRCAARTACCFLATPARRRLGVFFLEIQTSLAAFHSFSALNVVSVLLPSNAGTKSTQWFFFSIIQTSLAAIHTFSEKSGDVFFLQFITKQN
ncbi:hypothetical protein NDU88_006446 [Pleurodeles waltl]|uniref:Uncharacterized protein n=1 Tax=Pleurodeles waltl TaxID=8319 RepID=A0AAV7PMF9_PLEWA|nr:hypothetical protein NDU88_006446 [Pleurodeles waltl]